MLYHRMPIEIESPEEMGYHNIHINLAESSVSEVSLQELDLDWSEIKLEYTSHRGHEGLRTLIANESKDLRSNDVLLTGGAAMALFMIHTSLLNKEDHIIIVHPNYASNLEVPKVIGCEVTPMYLKFENQWELDIDQISNAIKPNTKLISLTSPQNPTGQILNDNNISRLLAILDTFDLHILVDETYRDACFKTPYPILASIHPRFISVLSFSKGFGLPGIRIGAIITKDQHIYTRFLAAKEMIQICNPPLEETIAFQFYKRKDEFLEKINAKAQRNLLILRSWLASEPRVEAIIPSGGVVCFVRLKQELQNYTLFYKTLADDFGTRVGPGHWFDLSDRYMRIGFGYTSSELLAAGLNNISMALDKFKD